MQGKTKKLLVGICWNIRVRLQMYTRCSATFDKVAQEVDLV